MIINSSLWTYVIVRLGYKILNMKLNSYCTFIFLLHQCSNKVSSPVAVPVQCGQVVVVFQIVCDERSSSLALPVHVHRG